MTLTTEVRINWPVPAVKLLDHVTETAGGDSATVRRRVVEPGAPFFEGSTMTHRRYGAFNSPGQGLQTLAGVTWGEGADVGDPDEGWPKPPAIVVLSIDNPYGFGDTDNRGRWVQANKILPAVVAWLDAQGVPRDRWWWEDETAGTFHPGTEAVAKLDTDDQRETWQPEVAPR